MSEQTQFTEQTLILRCIIDNKKVLLDKAFVALLGLPMMVDLFRKCCEISKNRTAKDIFNWVCISFSQEVENSGRGIALPIDKKRLNQDEYSKLMATLQMVANNMQQVSYRPPSDNDELSMHLWTLYHLYENIPISWPPTIIDICLNFSFAKLLAKAHLKIGSELTHTERKEIATRGSTETKRKQAEKWQNIVLAIYDHSEPIAPGTNLSEAIRVIQEQFEKSKPDNPQRFNNEPKWGWIPEIKQKKSKKSKHDSPKKKYMDTPSRDSIINLFKKKGIRDRDFDKRGPYWFKKM